MALDPLLFKRFHKPGSDVPVPPRPANPPPAKVEPEMLTPEVRIVDPVNTDDEEPTVEGGGSAPETLAEPEPESDDESEAEIAALEAPIESKEVTVFEQPKVHGDAGPVFKDRLELLDSLVNSELGISAYTIDTIRGHVKQIMMDLVTQPELDAILIDRDVHNVLAFIRHVKVDASEARDVLKVKKTVKKAKDSKSKNFDIDLTALGNLLGKGQGLPLSLEDLSKFK